MNTSAHSGRNTAYIAQTGHYPAAHGDWLAVHISWSWPQQLELCLRLYCKNVELDDTGHRLTTFMCVLIYHPNLEHHPDSAYSTAEPPVVPSSSKLPPPPKPSLYETVPLKRVLCRHSIPKSQRAGNGSNALTVILKWPTSRRLRLCQRRCDIQPEQYLEVNFKPYLNIVWKFV
jgi:hypothetical protein